MARFFVCFLSFPFLLAPYQFFQYSLSLCPRMNKGASSLLIVIPAFSTLKINLVWVNTAKKEAWGSLAHQFLFSWSHMWLRAYKKASLHIHPAWYYQDSTEHSRAGRQAYQKSSQRLVVTSFANVGSFKVVHHFFASVIRICTSGSFIEFVSGCEITPGIYFSFSLPSGWSHKLSQRSLKPLTHVKVNKTK